MHNVDGPGAMTLVNESGEILTQQIGECKGKIAYKQSGTNGFGYDPIFEVDGYKGLTMADISEDEKNKISHRSQALNKIITFVQNNLI